MTYEYRVVAQGPAGIGWVPVASLRLARLRLQTLRAGGWQAHIERRPTGGWEAIDEGAGASPPAESGGEPRQRAGSRSSTTPTSGSTGSSR